MCGCTFDWRVRTENTWAVLHPPRITNQPALCLPNTTAVRGQRRQTSAQPANVTVSDIVLYVSTISPSPQIIVLYGGRKRTCAQGFHCSQIRGMSTVFVLVSIDKHVPYFSNLSTCDRTLALTIFSRLYRLAVNCLTLRRGTTQSH